MSETTARLGGVILADEMGLGKTLQIIALLTLHLPPVTAPALIICPTSLIANWVREFQRFSEGISILVHRGADRAGTFRDLQRTHVVIATYDTVVNDIALFSSFEWSWVICDEAQAIKNPSSNRRMAIATIPRRKAIPMTGTPVENSLVDLWSLADFAIPGLLGSQGEFEQLFPDTVEAAADLATLTDPIILKRTVSEVAGDLPDRIEVDLPLELTDALASHYCQVRDETIAKYPVAGNLVATLQLQLVCAHPWLRSKPADSEGDSAEVSPHPGIALITPKMERTIALIKESFLTGNKVLVFSLFNRIGELLREAAPDLQHAFWGAINGSTPQLERQPIIDRFSNYEGPACLVLNPKAAGSGLNITAATTVIHFTPLWNPATEAQASARAHRRGQTRPVTIYRLYYEDTVERVMIDRSQWKSELGNEIVPLSSRDATDLQTCIEHRAREKMTHLTFRKKLSANDVGLTGAHQAGVLIPKGQLDLRAILPALDSAVKNPSEWLECVDDVGERKLFRYVYYNNKLHDEGGTRDEFRITHMTQFFRDCGAQSGDFFEISGERVTAKYRVRVVKHLREGDDEGILRIKLRGWSRVH